MKKTDNKNLYLCVALICVSISIVILAGVLLYISGTTRGREKDVVVDETSVEQESSKQEVVIEEEYEIKTPYGKLYYPKKWKKYLRIEKVEKEPYTIEFYTNIKDEKEMHLLDIVFNGEGTEIKTLKLKDGETLVISMVPYENDFDETWSEKEQLIVWGMREDISYLFSRLSEMEN